MIKYIIKRLFIAIPMLLGIALLTFILMRLTPGNYFDTLKLDPQISQETIEHYESLYQLDKPLFVQFAHWVKNLLKLELGHSFHYNIPVSKIIGGRLLNTFILSFASFLLTWSLAIPLGIWAAIHRNKMIDQVIQFFSYTFLSMPSFFLAMIFLYWASQSGVLPLGGMYSPNFDDLGLIEKILDVLKHLAIPTIALSIGSIAALQRIMRGNMLEVLGQQYILTARSKGLPEHRVINSSLPYCCRIFLARIPEMKLTS